MSTPNKTSGPDVLDASSNSTSKSSEKFPNLWSPSQLREERATLISAPLRINQKRFTDAYVSSNGSDNVEKDVIIEGVGDRNGALHNDLVLVKVNEQHKWKVLHTYVVEHLLQKSVWEAEDLELLKNATNLEKEPSLLKRWQQIDKDANSPQEEKLENKQVHKVRRVKVVDELEELFENKLKLKNEDTEKTEKSREIEKVEQGLIGGSVLEDKIAQDEPKKEVKKKRKKPKKSDLNNKKEQLETKVETKNQKMQITINKVAQLAEKTTSVKKGCGDSDQIHITKQIEVQNYPKSAITSQESHESIDKTEINVNAEVSNVSKTERRRRRRSKKKNQSESDIVQSNEESKKSSSNQLPKVSNEANNHSNKLLESNNKKKKKYFKNEIPATTSQNISNNGDENMNGGGEKKKKAVRRSRRRPKNQQLSQDNSEAQSIASIQSTKTDASHQKVNEKSKKKKESVGERLQRAKKMPQNPKKQSDNDKAMSREQAASAKEIKGELNKGSASSPSLSSAAAKLKNIGSSPKKTPKSPTKKNSLKTPKKDKKKKDDETWPTFSILSVLEHSLGLKHFLQRTGVVVGIEKIVHSRVAAGFLRPFNKSFALFSPKDSRVPRLKINIKDCPPDLNARPDDYQKILFVAKISQWTQLNYALGQLIKCLGDSDDRQVATTGFLLEHNIADEDFSTEITSECSGGLEIGDSELESRRDFRSDCVFTIDPLTARDLDDALSVDQIDDDHVRVAVHIADVSHFVKENSFTNEEASRRGTSVYLVDRVIPMLPRPLCEDLCSLNPGVDRLTFSVEWVFDADANIVVKPWFGKSVIRSCVKLAYEHAQSFIDHPQKTDWKVGEEIPNIMAPFDVSDISKKVNWLQRLALKLRAKREESGALRLDQGKLAFALDKEKGVPIGFSLHEQRHSNRLIEEFMLLANMSVAEKIYKSFPQLAVLRRHPKPKPAVLSKVVSTLGRGGVSLNTRTSLSLAESLKPLSSKPFFPALTNLLSKPMELAKYFCTGSIEEEADFWHYALSVPFYTHFTSPIRRYPDILVHRLLYAALTSPDQLDNWESTKVERQCVHCNERKLSAKTVSEKSTELHLALFVKLAGPLHDLHGIILQVNDESVDCLVTSVAVVKRVYRDKLEQHSNLEHWEYLRSKEHNAPELKLKFKNDSELVLKLFSEVNVSLMESERPHDFIVVITGTHQEN